MSNIMRGSASVEEVEELTSSKGRLSVVYAKDAYNINKDGDYAFSDNIYHPDTGEVLTPVKGYCTNGSAFARPCYYAEYEGKSGKYYYFDETKYCKSLPNARTIKEQIEEDHNEYLEKFAIRDLSEDDDDDEPAFFEECDDHHQSQGEDSDDSEGEGF